MGTGWGTRRAGVPLGSAAALPATLQAAAGAANSSAVTHVSSRLAQDRRRVERTLQEGLEAAEEGEGEASSSGEEEEEEEAPPPVKVGGRGRRCKLLLS